MRKLSFILSPLCVAFAAILLAGCAYNKLEPEVVTVQVSYEKDIKPIITARCYHCHSDNPSNPNSAGIPANSRFDHFDQLQNYALAPSSNSPGITKIVAQIKHLDAPGMPYDEPMLTASEIEKIESWVKQGAPNN